MTMSEAKMGSEMMTADIAPAPTPAPATRIRRAPIYGLLTANAISLVGSQLTALAIPWFVLVTTGSAAKTGITAFFTLAPLVLAAFTGGVLVDRLGHRRMSIVADLLCGITVALIPVLYDTIGLAFWALLLLVFLGGLFGAPGGTALISLVPETAELAGMRLERANSLLQGIRSLSLLIGPPLAGILIAVVGASNVLWLDAASFFISAILVGVTVPRMAAAAPTGQRYWDDVLDGLRFLRQDRLIRALVISFAAINFATEPIFAVILPVMVKHRYGSARDLGFLAAAFGLGALVSSLGYGAIGHRLPRQATLVVSFFGISGPVAILAAQPALAISLLALLVGGLLSGPINPLTNTVLQARVPVELRGRVFGTISAISLMAAPLSVLITGALIAPLGLATLLLFSAAGCALLGLYLWLYPAIRELG